MSTVGFMLSQLIFFYYSKMIIIENNFFKDFIQHFLTAMHQKRQKSIFINISCRLLSDKYSAHFIKTSLLQRHPSAEGSCGLPLIDSNLITSPIIKCYLEATTKKAIQGVGHLKKPWRKALFRLVIGQFWVFGHL